MSDHWPPPWIRALLPLIILSCLESEPLHSYALGQRIKERNFGAFKGGSLFPHLKTLEAQELITSEWLPGDGGPGRKQFHLTDQGRAVLNDQTLRLQELVNAIEQKAKR